MWGVLFPLGVIFVLIKSVLSWVWESVLYEVSRYMKRSAESQEVGGEKKTSGAKERYPADVEGGTYQPSSTVCRTPNCKEVVWLRSNGRYAGAYCCVECRDSDVWAGPVHGPLCTCHYTR